MGKNSLHRKKSSLFSLAQTICSMIPISLRHLAPSFPACHGNSNISSCLFWAIASFMLPGTYQQCVCTILAGYLLLYSRTVLQKHKQTFIQLYTLPLFSNTLRFQSHVYSPIFCWFMLVRFCSSFGAVSFFFLYDPQNNFRQFIL